MKRTSTWWLAMAIAFASLIPVASAAAQNRPDNEDTGASPTDLERPDLTHGESVIIEGDLDLSPPVNLSFARLRLNDPTSGKSWSINTVGDEFRFGTFFVFEDDGDVGSGTVDPTAAFHVRRNDGSARVFVQEANGTTERRTLFELENKGAPEFTFRDTAPAGGPNEWHFALRGGGAFEINKLGTGGPEALFRGSGQVEFGRPDKTFILSPTGNLTISGALTEGSSSSIKDGIVAVDAAAVLDAVRDLPLWEWSYRTDSGTRHLGPMAEDFHAALGLGASSTGIASLDTSGVALAAVQGLAGEVDERVAALEVENAELRARLADLEVLVEQLAAAD